MGGGQSVWVHLGHENLVLVYFIFLSKRQSKSIMSHLTSSGHQSLLSPSPSLSLPLPPSRREALPTILSIFTPGTQLPLEALLLLHLIQHPLGDLHGIHAGGNATVRGGMDDGLADLGLAEAVVPGAADVDGELGRAVQRHQHADVEQRAVAAFQPGSRPRVAPAPLGHQLLARAGELGRAVLQGAVHVHVAHHGSAHRQPGVEERFVGRAQRRVHGALDLGEVG